MRILRCRSDSGCAVEALRWISYLASFDSIVGLVAFCQSYFTAKVKIATLSKVVPCSRVGHIFRSWSPYPWRTGNLTTRNYLWIDNFIMNDDLNLECIVW